jgi:hypothetical protein
MKNGPLHFLPTIAKNICIENRKPTNGFSRPIHFTFNSRWMPNFSMRLRSVAQLRTATMRG